MTEPYLCGIRWAPRDDAPFRACTLAEGHPGPHETHTRKERTMTDIQSTPHGERILARADAIAAQGYDYPEALRIANRVETDPLGPEGVHGFGRCDRCGESYTADDEKAEVAGDHDDPAANILDSIIIHVGCISDTDVLA